MPINNIDQLNQRLNQTGTLSGLLKPEDFAGEGMVADQMARKFKSDLNPTQMRKVFHAFKQIERKLKTRNDDEDIDESLRAEITLLVPNLAYAVGRKLLPKEFYNVLKSSLHASKLQKVRDFRRLNQLLTAILAYQKYYSETEKKND